MTTLADALAEDIVELITTTTVYISLHNDDPGKTGASETTVVDRLEVAPADWAAMEDDTSTGGRRQTNDSQLSFGNATGTDTLTHAGIWTAASGGTFRGGAPLTSEQTTTADNPVNVPAGALQVVGAGLS